MANQPEASNSSTKLPISKDFLKKPGRISRHLWTFVEPWLLARQRFEERSTAIKKLEWKRDNLFTPVSKVLHDANGKAERKIIREDLQKQLWDEDFRLRIQSAREQSNAQLVTCTSLHAHMLTKVVEHFKSVSESNTLDCYAANLLPGNVNRTMASKAFQDVLSQTFQGVHPEGLDATIAKRVNVVHVALSTLEGSLRAYGNALFHNWKSHQQAKQVATKTRLDTKKTTTSRHEHLVQLEKKAQESVLTNDERNEQLSLQVAMLWDRNESSKRAPVIQDMKILNEIPTAHGTKIPEDMHGVAQKTENAVVQDHTPTLTHAHVPSHAPGPVHALILVPFSRASTRRDDSSHTSYASSLSSCSSRGRKRKADFAQPKNESAPGSARRLPKRSNKNYYPNNPQHSAHREKRRGKSPRHGPY